MGSRKPKIIILGAGPCGISAGWYLFKNKYPNYEIYEKNNYAGGLSASFKDNKGFVWDIGGHVLFGEHKEFSEFLARMSEGDLLKHKRDAWVRIFDTWIRYPFQNHIYDLPPGIFSECLAGLTGVKSGKAKSEVSNARDWVMTNFGRAISDYFMLPINNKMWSYPLHKMSAAWVKHCISTVNVEEIINCRDGKYKNWGPNASFYYPLKGGIGGIFRKAASIIGHRVCFGHELYKIDTEKRIAYFKNGASKHYDFLLNTTNLKHLISMLEPQDSKLIGLSGRLKANKLLVIGLGLRKKGEDGRSWMYFPEDKYNFYRVTNLSNYSPYNVPGADRQRYSSLLIEISFKEEACIDREAEIENAISGLREAGMISDSDKNRIESVFTMEAECGYPVPTVDRDNVLGIIEEMLKRHNILSRGRFGFFKYEMGNIDKCFMHGYEAAKNYVIKGTAPFFKGLKGQ